MKKAILLFAVIHLFSCTRKTTTDIPEDGRIIWFEQLVAHFENPPAEYRTAPFWVWNNDVSTADIDRTLEDFKEKGIGGVFLHPRYGMITEYLSDEWWDLVAYSLEKALELDLKLWIYDENSFPSGFAGGHVAAQMPEANSEGVALKPHYTNRMVTPENIDWVKHVFKKEGETWVEVTHLTVSEAGNGEFCFLELNNYETSKWFGGYSYVDLLKPGVTEKFMEITMPGYEKVLGHEFGRQVPGVFTDEPNTNTRRAGPIRFTPDLYEQFEKQWGYGLEPHLMSLITETGEWKRVRHNYQSTILNLFIERWSKPWYEYTEEKNLAWTGHYWEHGWPSPKEGPDNMAMYAWHQVPGIDLLFNREREPADQFGNVRNVKELSSVVNQFGRHRALSETYGASGWELTFDDMKRLGDWQYALGVNLMNQHLSYISLAGDRKHDFPQSFGPHAPYWGAYHYHADYFARLSLALSSGFQKNHILVIEPTTTAWMHYNPTGENSEMSALKEEFESFLDQMELYKVEYDLGSENIIKDHGRVENKKFIVNKAEYNRVILPPGLENLDRSTYNLLTEFAENGGEVFQLDGRLQYVDGKSQPFDAIQQLTNWRGVAELNGELFSNLSVNPRIRFENPELIDGKIFHMRRELDDGQLIFLTNFAREGNARIILKMEGRSVIELDPADGNIEPFVFKRKRGNVQFQVELPPSGSKLLFISNKRNKSREQKETEYIRLSASGNTSVEPVNPNVLNLDYVELTMGKFRRQPMYFYTAANEIWQAHGFPDNPWVSSSQFKTELVDADNFPPGSGFTVAYPFYVADDFKANGLQLVVERPWLYTVKVNENEVKPNQYETWLDPDFHVFDMGKLIQTGWNEVVLEASPFSIFAELQPVYLLGDFSVISEEKGWKLENSRKLELGSWKDQGMPFFGQVVAYSKTLDAKVESEYAVSLPSWEGTVAEVMVNGEHRGIIQSKADKVTFGLPYGKHEITVRVAGSLKNVLGPHHNVRTRGIVTPWSFKYAPDIQPPGNEYDLLPYGLMEDMVFWKVE